MWPPQILAALYKSPKEGSAETILIPIPTTTDRTTQDRVARRVSPESEGKADA